MKKKDYIFNLKNLIKNRVLFHAPQGEDEPKFNDVLDLGIDLNYPVFIMEKPLKKRVVEAFLQAGKEVEFNLILKEENKTLLSNLERCYVLSEDKIDLLKEFNINYKAISNYVPDQEKDFLKLNDKALVFKENLFYFESQGYYNAIYYKVKKFLLNGENYIIELTNTSGKTADFRASYLKNLPKGYYRFLTTKNGLKMSNLTSTEDLFLNTNLKNCYKFCSCLDGVDHSNCCRVEVDAKLTVKGYQKRVLFINFGEKEFDLKSFSQMQDYFNLSQRKNQEVFGLKIVSKNKVFERYFNQILPEKIWGSWLNGTRDEVCEKEYKRIRDNIVSSDGKSVVFRPNSYNISQISLFDGKKFKKISLSQ